MKKVWIVTAAVVVLLVGVSFWKGVHHGLVLADIMEQWLNAAEADQTVTIQIQPPGSEENQLTLTADTFWTKYANEWVFGLTAEGVTAYLSGNNLYLDTGKAYSLPEIPEMAQTRKRLILGLLLHGRITKTDDTYHVSMKTDELELNASIAADNTVRSAKVNAVLSDGTVINVTLTSQQPQRHPIPQPVAEAMVLARSERPICLTEPLQMLLPAAEGLFPLSGDLKLDVSCGILEMSETAKFTLRDGNAVLTRKDVSLELDLPTELTDLSPVTIAALLLREGEFTRTQDGAKLDIHLPSDAATRLLEALVPQAADLGITLGDSTLCLYITGDRLTSASVSAQGSIPFFFTTIPVDFSAVLTTF